MSWLLGAVMAVSPFLYGGMAFGGETVRVNPNADATIQQSVPNTNTDTSSLQVQSSAGANFRSVISFDLTPLQGAAVKVSSMGLRMATAPASSRTYSLFRLTQPWVEGQVTWNEYGAGSSWTTPGGTLDASSASSVSTGTTSGVTLTLGNIRGDSSSSNFVQDWVDNPATNAGFAMLDSAENSGIAYSGTFDSRTGTTAPYLDVTLVKDIGWSSATSPGPSQIDLSWTYPAGSTSSNYDGVTITSAEGSTAPSGTPNDGTSYLPGDAIGTGVVAGDVTSFSTATLSLENGDQFAIKPGTQYTFRGYTHDATPITGAASVTPPHYAKGMASPTVTTQTASGNVIWTYQTGATTLASPAPTGSGVIVMGGNDNLVRAVSDTDGTKKYTPSATVGGAGFANGAIGDRPTVVPKEYTQNPTCRNVCDVIYVGSGDGTVRAFRADTGAQLWASAVLASDGGRIGASPAVQLYDFSNSAFQSSHATYDLVVAGTTNPYIVNQWDNRVFGLNGNTGEAVFIYNEAQTLFPGFDAFYGSPYIDYATNSVWLADTANADTQPSIHHLSTLLTGNINTQQPSILLSTADRDVDVAPTMNGTGEFLFVITFDGDIVAVDTATTTEVTSVRVTGNSTSYPIVQNLINADGVVVMTTTGVHKRIFDRVTRTFTAGGWDAVIPNPSGGTFSAYPDQAFIYVGSSDGNLYKISSADGTFTTVSVSPGSIIGTPSYDEVNSKIYVGDSSGHIYALNAF